MSWRELSRLGRPYAEVIGDPIAHSKSPVIHTHWLRKLGIDGEYRSAHVEAADLGAYFEARRADPDWRGCNVTVPHKEAALAHVHSRTEDVAAIGAANTIGSTGGAGLSAYNTDWQGFLRPLGTTQLAGKRAIVIGAGGAARAVLYALRKRGVAEILLLNRTRERAENLLSEMGVEGGAGPLHRPLPEFDLLINTSTLGMTGQPPFVPDLAPLPPRAIVYDLVYAPLETPLMAAARESGLSVIGGLGMLIGQARAAFGVFFDPDADPGDDEELAGQLTS